MSIFHLTKSFAAKRTTKMEERDRIIKAIKKEISVTGICKIKSVMDKLKISKPTSEVIENIKAHVGEDVILTKKKISGVACWIAEPSNSNQYHCKHWRKLESEVNSILAGGKMPIMNTSFDLIDSELKGIKKGMIYCIAGDSGCGKTSFTCSIILGLLHNNPKLRIKILSLDMDASEIIKVLTEQSWGYRFERIFEKQNEKRQRCMDFKEHMHKIHKFDGLEFICPEKYQNSDALVDACEKADILIVDYVQLLDTDVLDDNNQMKKSTANLKKIARSKNVAVIAVAQINNRAALEGGNRRIVSYGRRLDAACEFVISVNQSKEFILETTQIDISKFRKREKLYNTFYLAYNGKSGRTYNRRVNHNKA